MTARRGTRGFTLIELVVVFVVFGILSTIALVTWQQVSSRSQAEQPRRVVNAIAAAQELTYQSRGRFAEDPVKELPRLDGGYSYVATGAPSTGDDVVSVGVRTVGGYDQVAIAVVSSGGTCIALRSYEPTFRGTNADVRRTWQATGAAPCSADRAFIAASAAGTSW